MQSTLFIDEALSSGLLLEFNPTSRELEAGALVGALSKLMKWIGRLKGMQSVNQFIEHVLRTFDQYKNIAEDEPPIRIRNDDLLPVMAIHDLQQDIIMLSAAICRALGGDTALLGNLRLNPETPLGGGEAERIEAHTATADEIAEWFARGD